MIKQFHVGVKGLIRHPGTGQILFMRSPSGAWDLPGGRIDEGERSLEETLMRELNEELPGISDISIGAQLGAVRTPRDIGAAVVGEGVDVDSLPGGSMGLVLVLYDVIASLPDPVRVSDEHAGCEGRPRLEGSELFPHAAHIFGANRQ